MLSLWRGLGKGTRRAVSLVVKALLTVGAFYLLLTHRLQDGGGGQITIWEAVRDNLGGVRLEVFVPFVISATAIKFLGILCSMLRWHLLLIGQGIRFNFWHIVGAFLTGRFVGTFLPSTVGLDGYKLYDVARFTDKVVEPAAATAVEKVMGLAGVFLTFLVALPFGFGVLGDHAALTTMVTVPLALAIVVGLFSLLFRPGLVVWLLHRLPDVGRRRIHGFVDKVSTAAVAYRGKGRLLAVVGVLSFGVHFCTAAMYYFTARAIGVAAAGFWLVTFASSIQIFATVMSPFTIAGEGVREIVQALLLAKHLGTAESVLSAALGFWAAEAMTLVGAVFLWTRGGSYRPRKVSVDNPVAREVHQSLPP
ncbi:MAG: flippase-like domain-containing protein [Deltaproteobacteria bacterium]|nr:flippase-like domain-containing protein [Deltaproteobacteria bacterium]